MPSLTKRDGTRLAYRVAGDSDAAEVLVCHPGGPGMSAAYFVDCAGLPDDRRLVLLDPRGAGGSDPPADGRYELEGYAADIEELREHLGLEQIDLLGHSHGGFVGMTYALAYPDRLRRLVLACSAPRFSPELREEAAAAFARHAAEPWYEDSIEAQRARQAWEFDGLEQAVALYARELRLSFAADGPVADAFLAEFAHQRPALAALRYFNERLAPRYDMRPRLAQISAPTLILNGEADFFGPQVSARELSAIPGSRVVMIADAGHWAFVEAPVAFRAAVEVFLRER
jgi:pimeloyl-ACP methyl ester carboxylesterase